MFSAAQTPLCCATDPSCGSAFPSGPGVLATSPTAYTPPNPSTVRSGSTLIRPPWPSGSPEAEASGAPWMAPPQNHAGRPDRGAVGEGDVGGGDLGDRYTEVQLHARAMQDLGGVVVGAVGERAEQRVPH